YEIPTDILIEREPFSLCNALLTESGKLARRRLEAVYGPMLDARRVREANDRRATLASLLERGNMSMDARVAQAIRTGLKLPPDYVLFERSFREHGGDSLDATELSQLLEQVCGVPIPPGLILDPRKDALEALCRYIAESFDDPRAAVR
ncbi:acyl carrier protein, partial [Streptococcus pneumoniae]|uniref:acyl carrier protein n=1 Tax=Streptococcus pneumoniae TaxID=1313 RepID=UPI000FA51618